MVNAEKAPIHAIPILFTADTLKEPRYRRNTAPSQLISSPTRSTYLELERQARNAKRSKKSYVNKRLRKPPSFDSYLRSRSKSELDSPYEPSQSDSWSGTGSIYNFPITLNDNNQTSKKDYDEQSQSSCSSTPTNELFKKVSSLMRFTGISLDAIGDDASSASSWSQENSECDWEPPNDDEDENKQNCDDGEEFIMSPSPIYGRAGSPPNDFATSNE